MFSLPAIARPNIASLKPYVSARSQFCGKAVLLDANENPFGAGENRYPDPVQSELRGALARRANLTPEQVLLGNGSDELIDLLMRAFCEPAKDNILICPPTFGMYSVAAQINNVGIKTAPLTQDYQLDTSAVLKTHANIVFLTNPNAPTGNLLDIGSIETVLTSFAGLVVIDEAYVDFADTESWTQRLQDFPNLVVLQTFSKYWGLAGCRIGMAFASAEIISVLAKIKMPYNVNSLSAAQALSTLKDEKTVRKHANVVITERRKLSKALRGFGFVKRVNPSQANFLWLACEAPAQVKSYLQQKGIIVRSFAGDDEHLRITVGTPQENAELLAALQEFSS